MFDLFDDLLLGPAYAVMAKPAVFTLPGGTVVRTPVQDDRASETYRQGPKGMEIVTNAIRVRKAAFPSAPPRGTVVELSDGSRHTVITHRSDVGSRGQASGEWLVQLERIDPDAGA